MIDLTGIQLPSLPVSGLEKIRELERHDGPLLTQLRHPRGDHYLYYWCDCDEVSSRWMLIRIAETDILRLIEQVVPLDWVIPNSSLDEFVYFVDAGADSNQPRVCLVRLEDIPAIYRPGQGMYLDVPEATQSSTFVVLIEKSPATKNIFSFPRMFSQAYAVLYALFILKPREYEKIPWKDGFGGMRFYDWLLNRIPGEDRPIVEAFQYASPGFIKFSLQRSVADLLVKSLVHLESHDVAIGGAYRKLYNFIKGNDLNEIYDACGGADDLSRFNADLNDITRRLLAAAGIHDSETLIDAATAFEAAKVSLSFIRRLRELQKFERDGIVRFPKVRAVDGKSFQPALLF